jgi:hypothetical protein
MLQRSCCSALIAIVSHLEQYCRFLSDALGFLLVRLKARARQLKAASERDLGALLAATI